MSLLLRTTPLYPETRPKRGRPKIIKPLGFGDFMKKYPGIFSKFENYAYQMITSDMLSCDARLVYERVRWDYFLNSDLENPPPAGIFLKDLVAIFYQRNQKLVGFFQYKKHHKRSPHAQRKKIIEKKLLRRASSSNEQSNEQGKKHICSKKFIQIQTTKTSELFNKINAFRRQTKTIK